MPRNFLWGIPAALLLYGGCDFDEDVSIGVTSAATDSSSSETSSSSTTTPADDDDDGLSNDVEKTFAAQTRAADSDQDGINDGLEFVGSNGDPLNGNITPDSFGRARSLAPAETRTGIGDRDLDGLGDTFENENSMNPDNPDMDGDGYSDGLELVALSNPFVASDRPTRSAPPASDGIIRTGAGPDDLDRDGISDILEGLNGTRATSRDTDTDGFSDGIEFLMGSNPNSAASIPNFSVPEPPPPEETTEETAPEAVVDDTTIG